MVERTRDSRKVWKYSVFSVWAWLHLFFQGNTNNLPIPFRVSVQVRSNASAKSKHSAHPTLTLRIAFPACPELLARSTPPVHPRPSNSTVSSVDSAESASQSCCKSSVPPAGSAQSARLRR
uniref:(northern house mosquito) hypothetical protein n=1 Tax=Culex pipiens TaxID=7175 RepID=A0A8D8CP93_CULPI